LSVIQFRCYKHVRENRLMIIITSQTSVTRALLLSSFVGLVERRVKGGECKEEVDIRFSFLGVYINKFSIM
jgi:hypothetical protein